MFEHYLDRCLTLGDNELNSIWSIDVRKSLLGQNGETEGVGNAYVLGQWDTTLDYSSSGLKASSKAIGFGRDENGNPSTLSVIFTDKNLKGYSRAITPLLSSLTTVANTPTSYYNNTGGSQYYTTGNTIYNHTYTLSSTIQRKDKDGNWQTYTYNPTGIVRDKRNIWWICSKDLGRISRLANNIDSLTGTNFTGQAGRIDYEEEIKETGTLLHPTGLAVLPEKSSMFDTDLDESGRFWICCDNGYIYEIKINGLGGIEILESQTGVGTNHFITCYSKEDL